MIPFRKKPSRLSLAANGVVLSALLTVPAAGADAQGTRLMFTPGTGTTPTLKSERADVKPGEVVATGPTEVREIMFPDGTALTLAAGTEVVVESYQYSGPGSGSMVLRLTRGRIRISGGTLNDTTPFIIRTSASETTLDAASAVIHVDDDGRTRANLLFGRELRMTSGGQTQAVQRPGYELLSVTSQVAPSSPVRQTVQAAARDACVLWIVSLRPQTTNCEQGVVSAGGSSGDVAQAGARVTAMATEQPPIVLTSIPGPAGNTGFQEIGSGPGGAAAGGFQPGVGVGAVSISEFQPSEANGDRRSLTQNAGNARVENNALVEQSRERGNTANRLFSSSDPFVQALGSAPPFPVADTTAGFGAAEEPDINLQYVFRNVSGVRTGVVLDRNSRMTTNHQLAFGAPYDAGGPFLIESGFGPWPVSGEVARQAFIGPGPGENTGSGSVFAGASHFSILQAGFSIVTRNNVGGQPVQTVERTPDNFLLIEVRPVRVTQIRRDELRQEFSTLSLANQGERLRQEFAPELGPGAFSAPQLQQLAVLVATGNTLQPLTAQELNSLGFITGTQRNTVLRMINAATNAENVIDESRPERFLFATGDVDRGRIGSDGRRNPSFTNVFAADRFFVSAGLENFSAKNNPDTTIAPDIRAFLGKQTALGLTLADSGVFVVNTGSNSAQAQNSLLHADFGMNGTGAAQQSTISVTVGEVKYVPRTCETCGIKDSFEAVVSGRTIGSSRGIVGNGQIGTIAITSPLTSTAAGGGNPQLQRDGYAGYLVLENFTPEAIPALPGGTEHALGDATTADRQYALLRLATATGQVNVDGRTNSTLTGWVGGLAEQENGPGAALSIVPFGSGTDPANFRIQTNPSDNRIEVGMNLIGHDLITLGGGGNPSAFVDDNRFGAANERVAMVNANVLRDGAGNLPDALRLPDGQQIRSYQHLQWGFFLGDTAGKAGNDLRHVHLGTWVAGRAADPSQLPSTGSATYQGHAIGNVLNAGSLYTAVGSFQNTWDFATRLGSVNMNFDGAQYSGTTQIRNGVVFDGAMTATGAARRGSVVGNFVQEASGRVAGSPPAGVIGRFTMDQTPGAAVYRASGIFAGERP